MGLCVYKNEKCCGSCKYWGGDTSATLSPNVHIRDESAACNKSISHKRVNYKDSCAEWQPKYNY